MTLPTAEELQRLPLRAIAAYAARAARRAQSGVRGAIEKDIVEEALSIAESVASVGLLDSLDAASALLAASRVVGAAATARRITEIQCAAMSVCEAAMTAYSVLNGAVEDPNRAPRHAEYAARRAKRAAVFASDVYGEAGSAAACNAARADYEILRRTFGEHDTVIVGDPIDLSDTSLLGPIV